MSAPPSDRAAAPRPLPKPGILDIAPYVPGKAKAEGFADPVKLSSNENILGSSPAARAAFAETAGSLHLYPDGRATVLREAIAAHYGLEPERLAFGDGSDELIHLICQVFLEPGDNVVQGEYGFGAYAIGARACQAEVRFVPEPNYRIDVDAMAAQVDDRTRIVFITNPANPTSTYNSGAEMRRLLDALPPSVVLLIDGAYEEFADAADFEGNLALARDYPNVIATRTFSKLHGLAALRIGWAYATAEIVDAIDRIRAPFNTSIPAQFAAVAALGDAEFQARSKQLVVEGRAYLAQQLGGIGLPTLPAEANFVMSEFPREPGRTAKDAEAFLAARGLIVRGLTGYGLPHHLRVTVGLPEHNRAVVEALAEFMGR